MPGAVTPLCCICLEPFGARRKPVELACGHAGCRACFARAGAAGHAACPLCRRPHELDGAALARRAAGFARDYGAWRRGAAKGAKGANVGAAVTRPRQRAGERDGGAARVVARTDAGDLMVATASPRRQVGKATGEV